MSDSVQPYGLDCSSSVHGILQTSILDWVAISFSHMHTTIHKIDNQQSSTIEHRELYSISCNNL